MKLHEIREKATARSSSKRVGRGIGSGKGKTSGAGVKGQKARTGVAVKGFEGGQMPLHRRLPKVGFNNIFAVTFAEVNLGRIQQFIDAGKLNASDKLDANKLKEAGVIKKIESGIKLLAKGELKSKITIEVAKASESAIKLVEKAGGKVTVLSSSKEKAE